MVRSLIRKKDMFLQPRSKAYNACNYIDDIMSMVTDLIDHIFSLTTVKLTVWGRLSTSVQRFDFWDRFGNWREL